MQKSGFAFLCAGVFLLPPLHAGAVPWNKLDLDTAEGYVLANRKMSCSLQDGKASVFSSQGHVWSRVPGEPDRRLFAVESMGLTQCEPRTDPKLGLGYHIVSREMTLYKDPETGEVLRTWINPWTGEEVEVIHIVSDPVNRTPTFGRNQDGSVRSLELVIHGDSFFRTLIMPFFYRSPLGGFYQEEVGGKYHATRIFNFSGNLEDLQDMRKDEAQRRVIWMEIGPWLPWMNMGDRPGMMYFNAVGGRLPNWESLSVAMKREIRRNHPQFRHPPPLDEKRRSEVDWFYFKKALDQRRTERAREARQQR